MRQTVLLLLLLTVVHGLCAQGYTGTITIGSYTQNDVTVRLAKSPHNTVTMTIVNVRFSHMMPVKVDVDIPTLTLECGHITGNNIVPLSNGKQYDKRLVRNLDGTADARRLSFTCYMGKKKLTFNGTRKR